MVRLWARKFSPQYEHYVSCNIYYEICIKQQLQHLCLNIATYVGVSNFLKCSMLVLQHSVYVDLSSGHLADWHLGDEGRQSRMTPSGPATRRQHFKPRRRVKQREKEWSLDVARRSESRLNPLFCYMVVCCKETNFKRQPPVFGHLNYPHFLVAMEGEK